jgi:hypothetical protein
VASAPPPAHDRRREDGGWLLAWKHPGFSAHVGETIATTDKLRLEDTAAYLVRNPLSLRKLVYLDGERAVIYRLFQVAAVPDQSVQVLGS